MILDSFRLRRLIFQIQYEEALALWDCAGAIGQRLKRTWPNLRIADVKPELQALRAPGIELQTGLTAATAIISGDVRIDQSATQLHDALTTWKEELGLEIVGRVSTRAIYSRNFSSIGEANGRLAAMGLARIPEGKVFDQSTESPLNSVDVRYRFEDEKSFALLRVHTEKMKYRVDLDTEFVNDASIEKELHRLNLDFDRGTLGTVKLATFRVEDWLKGFIHVLRRDLEKVIGDSV